MTKRIKRRISLLLLNIQLLFTFFLPLSPLIPQALASNEAPFAIEQIEESYSAYYLVDGVVFAEQIVDGEPTFSSESGTDEISYQADRLVIKTAEKTYLLENDQLIREYNSDSTDLSSSDRDFLYNQWDISGYLAETKEDVQLDVEYIFPLNEEVKVRFTKLPEEASTLRIEEIVLSEELQEQLGTVSQHAYDITTDMTDGEFEFDLVLPVEEDVNQVEVKYAETLVELENDAKEVEAEIELKDGEVKVEDVDHMTLFIVVKVGSVGVTLPFEGADDNFEDVWMYRANAGANTDLITDPTGLLVEDLGTEVVSMNAPGLGRSFLGYTGFTGGRLADSDLAEVSWMKYADLTANDHYLNFYIYSGIDWGSVIIVPNCSGADSWELCSTNDASVRVRYHHYNMNGWPWNWHWETNTQNFASFSDLMNSGFGNWNLYNDSDTSSSLTIVSGSSTTGSDLLNYVDGVHFLYEDGTDDFYNFESEGDVTRATVSFSPTAPSFTNSDLTVNIEFSEDVTDLDASYLSLTNATVNSLTRLDSRTFQVELAAIADGTVTMQVPQDSVVDMAGHGNAASSVYSYQVDTVVPSISNIKMFVNGVESTFMRSGDTVRVEADIVDNGSGVGSVRLLAKNASGPGYIDSGYFVNVGGDKYAREFTFPADGNYIDLHTPITTDIDGLSFYIKAFDQAGNYTNSVSTSFTYDKSTPEMNDIKMFVSEDGVNYSEKDVVKAGDFVRVEVEATDDSSGVRDVEFRIQNKNTGEYVAPRVYEAIPVLGNTYRYSFQIPTDGRYINTHGLMSEVVNEHSFWARATDNTGNYNHGIKGEFTYDNTAPAKTTGLHILNEDRDDLGCEGYTNNRRITVDWDDALDLDFDHFLYDIKDQDGLRTLTVSEITGDIRDEDGYYKYKVRTVDHAGNIGEASDWCGVTLDRVAPDVPSLVEPTDDSYHNGASLLSDWTDVTDAAYYIYESYHDAAATNLRWHAEYTVSQKSASNVANSEFWWRVKAVDAAGNESVWSDLWKVTIDNDTPTVAIDSLIINDNTPELTGTVADNHGISEIEVTVDGQVHLATDNNDGTWTLANDTLSALADGLYDVAVKATDLAGNEGLDATTDELRIDTVAPSAAFTHYIDGLLFSDSIAFVNNINLLSFDGAYTDPEPSSLLKQDSFVIFDAQADGSFRFMANGAAAYCSWRTGANTMAIAGLTDSLLAVPFTNCTSDLEEGEYYMSHQVYDNAIRHDIPSITQFRDVLGLHFFIDQTLPLVSSTIDPVSPDGDNDWYITRPTVTITAEDPANLRINEITKIEYQWDSTSGAWTEYTSPVQPLTEADHTLYYRAFDKAGNESLIGEREVKWDQTVPTVPLSVDADPEVSGGPDVDVTWNAATDNVGVDYYIVTFDNLDGDDDFTETVGSSTTSISTDKVEEAGTWRITVRAYDSAGNESDSASDDIIIDKEAPDAPVLSLGGTRDGEVDLSWTSITDADSYIILYGLLPGDYLYAANVGDVTSYTVQGLGTGDYYFVVRAMDASDNQSVNSNEVSTALLGVGGEIAEGFDDAENVLGVEDEATEAEQAAMVEEMGGEVAGANTCERARVWFWLGLAVTFIAVFFSAFLKERWNKILAFILVPALAAIIYLKFLGGACFNSNMMTWMNEVYWVPAYLTAIMAKLVTLFFIED